MNPVILLDPQPGWSHHFRDAAAQIHTAFADTSIHVEHIGSTAVPNLCAKPILDILLLDDLLRAVRDAPDEFGPLLAYADALAAAGSIFGPVGQKPRIRGGPV